MKTKEDTTGRSEEVSHVLCQFADHSFHCCRLDREIVVINKICFVGVEKNMPMSMWRQRHPVSAVC